MAADALGPKGGSAGPWVTLFLDLLGWSQQLLKYDEVLDYRDDIAKVSKTISEPIASFQRARMAMEGVLSGRVGPPDSAEHKARLAQLNGIARELFEAMTKHDFVLQQFGDSFVVSVFALGDERLGFAPTAAHLSSLFQLAGGVMTMLLSERIPVRGAIEIGVGTQYQAYKSDRKELVGASIVKAYRLESQVAEYPRIVIGPQLFHFIRELPEAPADLVVMRTVRQTVDLLKSMIRVEADGSASLDYLNPFIVEGSAIPHEVVQKAYQFIVDSYSRASNANNAKMLGRYGVVLRYWMERRGTAPKASPDLGGHQK